MKKLCTGPLQFTPYRPWSEERKQRHRDLAAVQLFLDALVAEDQLVKKKVKGHWKYFQSPSATDILVSAFPQEQKAPLR